MDTGLVGWSKCWPKILKAAVAASQIDKPYTRSRTLMNLNSCSHIVPLLLETHSFLPASAGSFQQTIIVRLARTMPKIPLNFDAVRDIGLKLPGVQESTAYGQPALKVHGQLLACLPSNRSAEPESLVVRVDFDDRAELLAADPDLYYVTDHYLDYSAVLVRLSRLTPGALRDLLSMAHKFVTSKATPRASARKRR